MSQKKILIFIFILLIVTPLFIYFIQFGGWLNWGNTKEFAHFGSYISGTLGFSTLALLIWYNARQIDLISHQNNQNKTLFEIEVIYRALIVSFDNIQTILNKPLKFLCQNDITWLGGQIKHDTSISDLVYDDDLFEVETIKDSFKKNQKELENRPFCKHLELIENKIKHTNELINFLKNKGDLAIAVNYYVKEIENIENKLKSYGFL